MKVRFLLLIAAIFTAQFAAAGDHGEVVAPGLATIVAGQLAGSDSCGNMTVGDLSQLDCGIGYNVRGYPRGALETNNTVEELLFQEMARRSDVASKCQLDFLTASRANNYQAYQSEALKAFKNIRVPLKTALDQNDLLNSYNATSYADLTPDMRLKRARLQPEGPAMRAAINLLPKTIPMGNHPEIQNAIFEMAERGVSDSEFQRGYAAAIEKLRAKMSESVNHYNQIRASDGTYTVNHELKVTFVQTGQSQALMSSLIVEPAVAKRVNCRLIANYKNGETVKAVAVAAAEIAGTTALMYIVPPIGAVAAEAATASRSVAMARTLFFAAGAASYAVDAAVIASMAPHIARECLKPTLMAAAGNASAICTEQVSTDGVMQEASAAKCAVSVAFATVPVLARFTKYIPRITSRPQAISSETLVADDVVVVGTRRQNLERRRSSGDDVVNPMDRPERVSGAALDRTTRRDIAALRRRGVQVVETETPTYLRTASDNFSWYFVHEPSGVAGAHDFGQILKVTGLPRANRMAGVTSNAFTHPEMASYMQKAKEMGYDIVVDTSSSSGGAAAYFNPAQKFIALQPNSTWQTFLHEYQHLEYQVYLRSTYLGGSNSVAREVPGVMPPDISTLLSRRGRAIFENAQNVRMPELALNESLAVNRELEALGWRRFVPSKRYNEAERYALEHQVAGWQGMQSERGLRTAQAQALATAERNLAVNRTLSVAIPVTQVGVVGGTVVTGAAQVMANAPDIYEQLSKRYRQVVYKPGERRMYGQRDDGSWVRVEP